MGGGGYVEFNRAGMPIGNTNGNCIYINILSQKSRPVNTVFVNFQVTETQLEVFDLLSYYTGQLLKGLASNFDLDLTGGGRETAQY